MAAFDQRAGETLVGRRVLVVGLGRTGLSCARFLARRGAEVAVTDSRRDPPALADLREALPDAALFLGGFAPAAFERADLVVLSPGVSRREPAVAAAEARGIPLIGDIELFARAASARVAAVTGSNGKSTVTRLLAAMAARDGCTVRAGGNLGPPVLELLDAPVPDLYVLELSSFQLETTHSLRPAAAAVLNVSADHMDRYRDLAEYAETKRRVLRGAGVAVLNADDPATRAMAEPDRPALWFTLGEPGAEAFGIRTHQGRPWLARGEALLAPAGTLRLAGRHNHANALAALALAQALGLERAPAVAALRDFRGLPHRCQWVAERDGIAWIDDSKGTNVGATAAAVAGMDGPVVLIAGGDGKGAGFTPLRAAVEAKARAVVLIGRDAPRIEAALEGAVPTVYAADMQAAVDRARELARPGDRVLLSPACASFDMFRDYEARGEAFVAAVRRALG